MFRLPRGRVCGSGKIARRARLRLARFEPLESRTLLSAYYVNDGATANDEWCSAVGDDANDGLSAATPKASLPALLSAYTMQPGDTVRIDTGAYHLTNAVRVDAAHAGSEGAPVSFVASPYGVRFDRSDLQGNVWELLSSYVVLTTASSTQFPGVPQHWMQISGGAGGVLIEGSNVQVSRCEVSNCAQMGIEVYNGALGATLDHCLVHSIGSAGFGDDLQLHGQVTVENCTLMSGGQAALMFSRQASVTLRNNILAVDGAGSAAIVAAYSPSLVASDYNDLFVAGGAIVAYDAATRLRYPGLADWRTATGNDLHSLNRDPQFVDPAGGDYHLASTAGSYHGGAWMPDAISSPGIDTGLGDAGAEPDVSGTSLHAVGDGARNLGAYGGTEQGSRTPLERLVWLYEPTGGEIYATAAQTVRWTWVGQAWTAGDILTLELSDDAGASWASIPGAAALDVAAGTFAWDVSSYSTQLDYQLQATVDPQHKSDNFQIRVAGPLTYYVNDTALVHDQWCVAPGSDANDGLSPATPKASVQAILDAYVLQPGDTVCIDTGDYSLTQAITVTGLDTGSDTQPLTFQASPYGVTFQAADVWSKAWQIDSPDVTLTTAASAKFADVAQSWLKISGADTGIWVTGRDARISRCELTDNVLYGLLISPGAAATVENCLVRNTGSDVSGDGLYAEGVLTLRNSTIYGNARYAVYAADGVSSTLTNNILVADGSGRAAVGLGFAGGGLSDYNDLYATGGALLGYGVWDDQAYASLAAWQTWTAADAHSFTADPLFADPAGGDFHELSNGGRYHPALGHAPQSPAAWVVDSATSPAIDAGDPTAAYANESAPNGNRVNLGAYANTEQAGRHDGVVPTVQSITRLAAPLTNAATVQFQVLFSEQVTGVAPAVFALATTGPLPDVAVQSVTPGSGPSASYIVTVATGSGGGTLRLDLNDPSGAVRDLAGNAVAPATFTSGPAYTVDRLLPVVTVNTLLTNNPRPQLSGTVVDPAPSSGLVSVTVVVNGETLPATINGNVWSVTVPGALPDDTYDVEVSAVDLAGNVDTDVSLNELTVDLTAPTVTVNQAAGQADPSRGLSAVHFALIFSEPVTDFTALDVALGGTASGNWALTVTGGGAVYDVAVSGVTHGGTLLVNLPAGVAHDAAGNANLPATHTDNQVTLVLNLVTACGVYDPLESRFYLKYANSEGVADVTFGFGAPGWTPLFGDWNGDGRDTIGLFQPEASHFYLRNSNTTGSADIDFGYGDPSQNAQYVLVMGDWNGDGVDTIGLYHKASAGWFLRNSNTEGVADLSFGFGVPGSNWMPIVGDWDGDGRDTIGLYDPATGMFYLRNSHTTGIADIAFPYGAIGQGWTPLIGDWDGDGRESAGFYQPGAASHFYLRNAFTAGVADVNFGLGFAGVQPLVGNWLGLTGLPLMAESGMAISQSLGALPDSPSLAPLVSAALANWSAAGVSIPAPAEIVVADLPGSALGLLDGQTLLLDRDAAGHGWFIDPTPAGDEEFAQLSGGNHLQAVDPRAVDRMDLLSVVEHELGHLAGLPDLDAALDNLMSGMLASGVRRQV